MDHGGKKAIVAAFFANLGIAVAKFVGFLITQSAGLLAEAAHSLADTGNQALLMFGGKRSRRPADDAHPFGYGPERYFWSFVVALVLFSMGGLFALYEGISKFRDPHEVDDLWVAVAILLFAIAAEAFSLTTAVRESRQIKLPGVSWWQFVRRAKSPELPVVLLEDTGAEIGLLFALTGVLLAHWTGDARWDALGSIAIGLLLVVIAIVLATEMKELLVGESALEEEQAVVEATIRSAPHVVDLIHFRTMHLGPDRLLVAAKIEFDRTMTIEQLARAIDGVEVELRAAVARDLTIYLEPDIRRPGT